jgi:hypothetical protein
MALPICPTEYGEAGSPPAMNGVGDRSWSGLYERNPALESLSDPGADVLAVESLVEENIL